MKFSYGKRFGSILPFGVDELGKMWPINLVTQVMWRCNSPKLKNVPQRNYGDF